MIGLLKRYDLIANDEQVQSPYNGNIWKLRIKALDDKLSGEELARVIYHITKVRGFKSSRKEIASGDEKLQKANKDMQVLEIALNESKSRTIGEYLYKTYGLNNKNIRNKFGNYTHLIKQDLNQKELELILRIQKEKGHNIADSFVEELLNIFNYRKGLPSFDHFIIKTYLKINGNHNSASETVGKSFITS